MLCGVAEQPATIALEPLPHGCVRAGIVFENQCHVPVRVHDPLPTPPMTHEVCHGFRSVEHHMVRNADAVLHLVLRFRSQRRIFR